MQFACTTVGAVNATQPRRPKKKRRSGETSVALPFVPEGGGDGPAGTWSPDGAGAGSGAGAGGGGPSPRS